MIERQSAENARKPDAYQDDVGGVWMNLRKHPEGWPGAYNFDSECTPLYLTDGTEVARLNRWKAEALPVMSGLQEVGHALGLPLGERITGRAAVDAALDLRNAERERAQTVVVDVLEPLIDQAWESGRREAWEALRDARFVLLKALAIPTSEPLSRPGQPTTGGTP